MAGLIKRFDSHMSVKCPSEEFDADWLWAQSLFHDEPVACGKWMLFVHVSEVDAVWDRIRDVVEMVRALLPDFSLVNDKNSSILLHDYPSATSSKWCFGTLRSRFFALSNDSNFSNVY
eukprot:TRINITY_DN5211_c0_g1_i1.p1 TRINITY_DN5211_c0_g1~~TRINITY_DN5211_c0_g1_i1.p1  ORF type:complete len:118 (-),score=0.10 TRINITY_DN5211_c0_g1_i1:32-385(-)